MAAQTPEMYQTASDDVILEALGLLTAARHASFATLSAEDGHPQATRVGLGHVGKALPIIFVSALSPHTRAIAKDSRCSLLVGEVTRGDPMINPRLTLKCFAEQVETHNEAGVREAYLLQHPKSKLYQDLPDFAFFQMNVSAATYIAGFGKAFQLDPELFVA